MDTLKSIARRAMAEHDLEPDFPPEALRELDALSQRDAGADVRDLRELLWCSIDNDDSRDLDQLTVSVSGADGAVRILVAIADVDALVEAGTAIDEHARTNTTSVYTAAQIFPMLPEKLSTDLTSLNEGEARLAIVIDMTVGTNGEIAASDIYRARVFNRAKLAYGSVAAWLDGHAPPPRRVAAVAGLEAQLRTQDQAARALRRVRRENGALNVETVQARPVFKEERLTDLRADERNTARELIEDFMVGANGVVARFLAAKGRASIRRVLRSPERWPRIVALAKAEGGTLPAAPDPVALNAFLAVRRETDPQGFPDLSLSVVKLLGAGEYSAEPPGQHTSGADVRRNDWTAASRGHFGLAVRDYAHSTAPNRRLPDLITQRLIKATLRNEPPPYALEALQVIAAHCNLQEKNAAKVERQVRKAASAMLLLARVGQRFRGVITGASEKGTWARIEQPIAEGKVVRGFDGLDVGDRVTVELLGVSVERGFIDFGRS